MDDAGLDQILRRARQRDPDALRELVDLYSPRVYGLIYRLTGSRDAAEDLLQMTFLRVVRTIPSYKHTGRFEAWLFRIAANLVRDRGRSLARQGRLQTLHSVSPDGANAAAFRTRAVDAQPDEALARREASERLQRGLVRLSVSEREIILLRHFSDLSFREIADLLNIPLGTALSRAHRALARLRELLGESF